MKTNRKTSQRKRGGRRLRGALSGGGAYYPGGRVLRGSGGFFDDIGDIFKTVAKPLVNVVGQGLNSVVPGSGDVVTGIARLVGAGAYYPVKQNAILAQPVPKVGSAQDKGITYSHQEFLGDVTSSVDWELTQFRVNPGLPETFPWLSTMASSFQKYKIHGLVFYLRSTSSVAISNSTDLGLGTVLGGFQYNVYDNPPASKVDMLALSGSLSGKPSDDHIYPMECAAKANPYDVHLVRHTGVPDDAAKYDHAIFNLATFGFPGEYALGELWVSYNITLMAPKIEDALPFYTQLNTALDITDIPPGRKQLMPASHTAQANPPMTQNTLGWEIVTHGDGHPCYSIPAGTSGYYAIQIYVNSTDSTEFFTAAFLAPEVLDETGEITKLDGTTLPTGWSLEPGATVGGSGTYYAVWHIAAKPDKPLLFRVMFDDNGITGTWYGQWSVFRVSDQLVRPASTGSGVVATASKVRRQNLARLAKPRLARQATMLRADEPPAPPGARSSPVEIPRPKVSSVRLQS